MDQENNRGNLSEMERIHRGLEAFLEKEVYEEYKAGGNGGGEGCPNDEKYTDTGAPYEREAYKERGRRQGRVAYDEYDADDGLRRKQGHVAYDEYDADDGLRRKQGHVAYDEYGADDELRQEQGHGVYDEYSENDVYDTCDEYGKYGDYDADSEYNEYEEFKVEEPVRAAMMRQQAEHSGAGQPRRGGREQSARRRGDGREQSAQRRGDGREQSAQRRGGGREQSAHHHTGGNTQSPGRDNGGKKQSPQSRGSGKKRPPQREERGKSQSVQRQGRGKGQSESGSGQSAGKKKHRVLRRFLTVALVLLLAVVALWYVTVSHLYDKVEYAPTEILTDQPMKEEGVTNILLIGNDSRAGGGDGRSDAMILVSISNRTKTIYLTSLLRDIYVEIPGHESNRLNAAYAFGGPKLLLETIKHNLDIEVNRYVQVNFQAFANLIDAVGGVELELTNEEVQLVNAYLNEYNMLENRPIDTDYLPTDASGLLHLNGPQALAYSRNRYIGSDFGRTERQRKILEAVFRQMPASVLTNLDDMIDGILPNLTTNISRSECYTLSLDVPKLLTYELVQASIPIAGSYQSATIRKMAVLQVDFEKNREFIRTQIYGEDKEN